MNADSLSLMTKLLAAHGVYALTILFIFYQQRRTYNDFKNASPENRPFLQRVYKSSVVATYILAALSTVAWGYGTFRRAPYVWVDGAIDDVRNELAQPVSPRDPPSVVESIEPQSGSLQRFMSKIENCDPNKRLCQLRWALKTQSDIASIVFKFSHHYNIAKARPSASDPNEQNTGPIFESDTVFGRFRLDASTMDLSGRELSLTYEPDKDMTQLGKLYLRNLNQELVLVPWERPIPESGRASSNIQAPFDWRQSASRLWTVFAEGIGSKGPQFGPRGEYQEEFGRSLRSWLGGAAVEFQQMAVQIVVEGRERAFKFITDTQTAALPASVNRSVLTSNLVRAVDEIEARGSQLPPALVASLAAASSQNGNYAASARLFDKVRGKPLEKTEWYFSRGLAFREMKRYPEAIADLEKYAHDVQSGYSKAVAFTSIGISYRRSGNAAKAVPYYRQAIKAYPNYPGPYNALAYLYSLDNKHSDFAEPLALVNKALELQPDEPNYLDTKGWVLYRMGKYEDARKLLETALRSLPGDSDIEEHLKQVRRAIGQASQFKK